MHSYDRTFLASLGFADADKKDKRHDLACQYLCQEAVAQKLVKRLQGDVDSEKYRLFAAMKTEQEHIITKGEGRYKTTIGWADVLVPVKYDLRNEDHDRLEFVWMNEVEQRIHKCASFIPIKNEKPTLDLCKEVRKTFSAWSKMDSSKFEKKEREHISTLLESSSDRVTRLETLLANIKRMANSPFPGLGWIFPTTKCFCVLIEVKIARVPVGDVIRQIKLYRDHLDMSGRPRGFTQSVLVSLYDLTVGDVEALKREGIFHLVLGKGFTDFAASSENRLVKSAEI